MVSPSSSFAFGELSESFHGGAHALRVWKECRNRISSDAVFSRGVGAVHLSRKELYRRALQKAARCYEIKREMGLNEREFGILRLLVGETMPTDLHHVMFQPIIQQLGSEEQKQKWLPLAETYKIIGTYAQTELGHGSNVQGIETRACYDKDRDEFILSTPTLSATKWWPGALGKTATHAVVMARLILPPEGNAASEERDMGPHVRRPLAPLPPFRCAVATHSWRLI